MTVTLTCIGMVLWYPLYSNHSLVYQINFFLRIFPRVQYISFYIPYFVYCMLIKINVCFVYLGYKLASQIDYACPSFCIQTTFLYCTLICFYRQYCCRSSCDQNNTRASKYR